MVEIVAVIFLSAAILAVLVWFAVGGAVWAGVILGAIGAAVLIFAGSGISLIQAHIAAKREQENFNANAKENLSIMLAMQKVQNAQNGQLLKQARELPLLGQNGAAAPSFDFEEGIFDELED